MTGVDIGKGIIISIVVSIHLKSPHLGFSPFHINKIFWFPLSVSFCGTQYKKNNSREEDLMRRTEKEQRVMMQLAGYGFTDLWDRRDGDAPFGRAGGEDFLRRKGIQKESVDP